MKNSFFRGSSLVNRWLATTSDPTIHYSDDSHVDPGPTSSFSPPPLTESSSTAASASTLLTPRTTVVHSPPHWKSSRTCTVKTPGTPPTRHVKLPSVTASREPSVSIPVTPELPRARSNHVKLHRLLNHDPIDRALVFDVSLPTSFIRQYPLSPLTSTSLVVRKQPIQLRQGVTRSPQPIPERELSQFATTPPVAHLRITTEHIPWAIDVRGRTSLQNDPNSLVRVIDVLEAIQKSLRTGVTSEEWNRLQKTSRDQIKKAYSRRCLASRAFTLTGYEEKQGVRRVDYLQDKTMFLGLTMRLPVEKNDGYMRRGTAEERTWVMMLGSRSS